MLIFWSTLAHIDIFTFQVVKFVDGETEGKKSSSVLVINSQPEKSDQAIPTHSAGNLMTVCI